MRIIAGSPTELVIQDEGVVELRVYDGEGQPIDARLIKANRVAFSVEAGGLYILSRQPK